MDKILIVGHPHSGHDTIERMLAAAGMAPARPSRREGLRPDEISSALCRANTRALLEAPDADGALRQLEIGPVWQGLALDLLLANIDQPVWGWSDPQSVVLLDYWREIDPDMLFTLVYEAPDSVLASMTAQEAAQLTPDSLARLLRNWLACNATLLRFFLHNPGRCVLVQGRQARVSADGYFQTIQSRLRGGWEPRPASALTECPARKEASGAVAFLSEALMRQHPECQHLYEALQACADLPAVETDPGDNSAPMAAWLDLATLNHDQLELRQRIAEQRTRIDALGLCLTHRDTVIQQHQQQARVLEARAHSSQQERERLTAQLQQLHAAFETQGQQRQQLTTEVQALTDELQHIEQVAAEHRAQVVQLNLQLAQHQLLVSDRETALQSANTRIEQLQATQAQLEQASQQGQEQLLGQIHQIQLELETHFLQRQQLTAEVQSLTAGLRQMEKLATDRQEQVALLERQLDQQRQLVAGRDAELQASAIRIGQLQAAHGQQEAQRVHLETTLKASEERIAGLVRHGEQLRSQMQAEIQAQADQHLARLQETSTTNVELAQENAQLLTQLHQVQVELERHFLELQQVRQAQARAAAAIPPAPVGAAERVKSHLSYRLGSTMVQHSRSLTGWLCMPFALARVTRQYRREQRASATVKLPPLHKYRDAQEADRVKNHLSYRLGQTLVRHAATPVGWFSLPFALQREVKAFRLQRQH